MPRRDKDFKAVTVLEVKGENLLGELDRDQGVAQSEICLIYQIS